MALARPAPVSSRRIGFSATVSMEEDSTAGLSNSTGNIFSITERR